VVGLWQGDEVDVKHVKYFAALRSFWHLLRETFTQWTGDNATVLGAALAFYTLFSLAPLLIIITAVVGYFLGQEAVQANLLSRLAEFVGQENAQNIMTVIHDSYRPGSGRFAAAVAVFLMLFGASTVFLMLKSALNNIWKVTSPVTGFSALILDRIKSFVVVLLVGLLLFISMVLKSLLAAFYETISRFLVVPGIVLDITDLVFSLVITSALFAILYKVLPDAKISWGYAIRGAIVSALLFSIGNFFLGLYLTRQTVASAYGAAGSLVVILIWVYYSALIIFLGAEFTQVYARSRGENLEQKNSYLDGARNLLEKK
jgi:membrane protein